MQHAGEKANAMIQLQYILLICNEAMHKKEIGFSVQGYNRKECNYFRTMSLFKVGQGRALKYNNFQFIISLWNCPVKYSAMWCFKDALPPFDKATKDFFVSWNYREVRSSPT